MARLELVDGTIADAGKRAKEIAADTGAFLASTFNEPYRVEGKKTAWLEIFAQLGMRFPATIVTSVGGGVAAVAAWKAAEELTDAGWVTDEMPRIVGVQPDDCAPITKAFAERRARGRSRGPVSPRRSHPGCGCRPLRRVISSSTACAAPAVRWRSSPTKRCARGSIGCEPMKASGSAPKGRLQSLRPKP